MDDLLTPEIKEHLNIEGKIIAMGYHDGYEDLKSCIRAGLIKAFKLGVETARKESTNES